MIRFLFRYFIYIVTPESHIMQTYDKTSTKPTQLTTPRRTPFNTIIPYKLVNKVNTLGPGSPLCSQVMGFLTDWPQQMRAHRHTTGLCVKVYALLSIIKFMYDARGWLNRMLVRGWSWYQVVQQYPVLTLMTRLLTLYLIKSKVDGHWLKEKKGPLSSHIRGEAVEYAENLMSLGVTMSESWHGLPTPQCWWRRHKKTFSSENLNRPNTLYWISNNQIHDIAVTYLHIHHTFSVCFVGIVCTDN